LASHSDLNHYVVNADKYNFFAIKIHLISQYSQFKHCTSYTALSACRLFITHSLSNQKLT